MVTCHLMPLPEFGRAVGLGKTAIYEKLNEDSDKYDPTFPKPLVISSRCVRWRSDETQAWIDQKSADRDTGRIERHEQATKAAKAAVAKRRATAVELAGQA